VLAQTDVLIPLRISLLAPTFPLPILLAKYGRCTLSGVDVDEMLKL
jgi:hypothetical protein